MVLDRKWLNIRELLSISQNAIFSILNFEKYIQNLIKKIMGRKLFLLFSYMDAIFDNCS